MVLRGEGRSVLIGATRRRSRRPTIVIHSSAGWRTIVIPVPVTILIAISSRACSSAATARFEVHGLTAHWTLGAILAGTPPTAAGRIAIPFIVVVVWVPQQVLISPVGTGVQVHLGQRHLDQLAVALAMTRRIQAVVEAFAHEAPLPTALPHALLDALAGDGATHPVGGYPFAGQDAPEAG